MKQYVAFLRGINLGNRRMPMARLAQPFRELGFAEVSTFIASGNVLFATKATAGDRLERRIATQLEQSLGYPVETFVRTRDEIRASVAARPFADEGLPGVTVTTGLLHEEVPLATAQALQAVKTATDEFAVGGRELHWLCRIRTSESKIWAEPALKALRLPTMTMRNRTTLTRLVALFDT